MSDDRVGAHRAAAVRDGLSGLASALRSVKFQLDFPSDDMPSPQSWNAAVLKLVEVVTLVGEVGAGLRRQISGWRDAQGEWDPVRGNGCGDAMEALDELAERLRAAASSGRDAATVLSDIPEA